MSRHLLSAFGLAVLSQAAMLPAMAALGADVASVEADRAHMNGELNVTSGAGYQVHEIRAPSGTLVREYVSAAGKVFAVSWRGPRMPDLRQTLGGYFEEYQAAARVPHGGHHQLRIDQPDFVLHSSGHMRAFVGHAYVPALMPQGIAASDIR